VESQVPDDNEVGNASNGVVSPLGWVGVGAESSEETGEDHDHVSGKGKNDVTTVEAGEEAEIEKEERSGDGPVNVTGPVDLAVDVLGGVRDVLVLLSDLGVVVRDTVTTGHGEVGDGSAHGDDGGDDVEQALRLGSVSEMKRLLFKLVAKLTTGMFHDMAEKAAVARVMMTKTTLQIVLASYSSESFLRCDLP
jgi:hypothetical protein